MPQFQIPGVPVDRHVPTPIAFMANAAQTLGLDCTAIIAQIDFRLLGTLTNTAYTAAPIKTVEAVENLIASLRIQGTAKLTGAQAATFCDVEASHLAFMTRILETTAPIKSDIGTANAAYAFESNFSKYFIGKRMQGGNALALDARLLNTLNIFAQWRDQTAMVSGGTGGTSALSGVNLFATLRTYEGGAYMQSAPYMLQSQRRFNITAQQDNKDFLDIPQDGILMRQVVKGLVGANTYSDPSDAMFGTPNKIEGGHVQTQIKNYRETRYDTTYGASRAQDKILYSLESIPSGYTILDYAGRTASLSEGLDLRGNLKAKNVIDVQYTAGSTNTITITDERVVLQRSASR